MAMLDDSAGTDTENCEYCVDEVRTVMDKADVH